MAGARAVKPDPAAIELAQRSGCILAIAERKLADLHARGIRSIVDLTTVDLGRDIDLIVDVARRSRVHVIVATGVWWMPQRYFSAHGVDHVAELFIKWLAKHSPFVSVNEKRGGPVFLIPPGWFL